MKSMRLNLFIAFLVTCAGGVCWFFYDDIFDSTQSDFNLAMPVSYFGCSDSQYYDGYGVEALDTADLGDYIASLAIDNSSVCFKVVESSSLKTLKIVWYSDVEAAKYIEILGTYSDGNQEYTDVLWSKDQAITLQSMSGYYYSDFKLKSDKAYSSFRVRYLSGGVQNRLLIRAIAPFFHTHFEGDVSKLLSDVFRISGTAPYGNGVANTAAADIDELADELRSQDSLHCGSYSYLLAYEVAGKHKWTAIGALSKLQAAHTVVEMDYKGKTYTVDPTLGALYFCSYSDMQESTCDFSKTIYTDTYNPVMWRYKGEAFYPGAKVQGRYSELQEYYDAYQKLNLN